MKGRRPQRPVSAKERAAAAATMVRAMDADRDGGVSAAEKIKVVDRNGDGVLTAKEHAGASRAMSRKMDTDKDGHLSRAELDAGHAALKK
jgi:Ca2+-binding EF-hand superfamily protein